MALKRQIAETLLAHLDQPGVDHLEAGEIETLQGELSAVIDSASQRYPFAVDTVSFIRWLAERTTVEDTVTLPAHAEDLYLTCACASGDAAAMKIFDRQFLEQARSVVRRLGCVGGDEDDVLQEVREKLLVGTHQAPGKIHQYAGSGPLLGWVRAVAGRQALAKSRRRKPNETLDPDFLDLTDDPHLRALKQRYRTEFRDAFRAAVAALSDSDRSLLADVVIREVAVGELAKRHGVHRVTASRWLAKIRHALLEDTRTRLAHTLDIATADIDSVIRLIDSQLDVSLYSVLVD